VGDAGFGAGYIGGTIKVLSLIKLQSDYHPLRSIPNVIQNHFLRLSEAIYRNFSFIRVLRFIELPIGYTHLSMVCTIEIDSQRLVTGWDHPTEP